MKRTFLFLWAAILLGVGLQSCDKENNNGNNNGGNGSGTTSVQWVDLGLPSGLLWADRNVGAENPEDYGNYYAWGETAPKEVYNWDTYAYGNYIEEGYVVHWELTKYCTNPEFGLNGFADNLTTLEASDDAATVNLGGKARMPRDYEWQELMDNTTSTWTTRNGIYGHLLTASNGKSIFLPAGGWHIDSHPSHVGEHGYYWLSTLRTDEQHGQHGAWSFGFYWGGVSKSSSDRANGFSVRAVRDR